MEDIKYSKRIKKLRRKFLKKRKRSQNQILLEMVKQDDGKYI